MGKLKDEAGNKELFEIMPIPQAVASMCVPGIFSTIVTTLYTLADTYFVGMLNDPVQSAAISVASAALYINMAISNLFGVGSSSYLSRSLGKYDYEGARKVSAMGVYWSMIFGLLASLIYTVFSGTFVSIIGADQENAVFVSDYLFWTLTCGAVPSILNVVLSKLIAAEGYAAHASIGTMSGCVLNIILDPFFVLPRFLNMGAAGAGLATLLSNWAAVGYFIFLLICRRKRMFTTIHPQYFTLDGTLFKDICVVGIPAAIQACTFVITSTVRNNLLRNYGSSVVAAYGISYRIVMLPVTIVVGSATGIMPLIGYNYSSRNIKRMQGVLSFTLKIGMVCSCIIAVLVFAVSPHLIHLFIDDPEVVRIGGVFLQIACPSLIVMFLVSMDISVFQSCGRGRSALVLTLVRKFISEIPLTFLMARLVPVYGMAIGEPVSETIIGVLGFLAVQRMFRGLSRSSEPERVL